jgi:hypothetical protein
MVQALTESVIECSRLAEEQEPYQQDRDHPANPIHATASLHPSPTPTIWPSLSTAGLLHFLLESEGDGETQLGGSRFTALSR